MLGCYLNCYVAGDFNPVFTPFLASLQFKNPDKSAGFELVSTYLHLGQVLKTGNTKVFEGSNPSPSARVFLRKTPVS